VVQKRLLDASLPDLSVMLAKRLSSAGRRRECICRPQFVNHLFPLSVLSVEARHEAASLVVDVAGERRAEVAGHQRARPAQCSSASRRLCARPWPAQRSCSILMIDLQGMVRDVAAEQSFSPRD
jgi:hypothetical protein